MTTLKKQKKNTKDEFDERAKAVIVEFAQQVSSLHHQPSTNHSACLVLTSCSPNYCDESCI